ncbi:MAG TPA: bacteriohopanetetrol glucosamine biosynthesis glycosyltransferase HpnI [Elusimicrobiota bacterium]|nr:bacteriohopanetetrol glucosamine biosynthesis glycosyltransferase HpnI [Elusimicrobiota bacterium]
MVLLQLVASVLIRALAALSWTAGAFTALFSVASVLAVRRLWKERKAAAGRVPAALPPVTVLKPIKGLDREMYASLASFLDQDYPEYQVIFCVQDADDAALPLLRRLKADFPERDVELVVSSERIGFNPKVNNLANAEPAIKHELLLISDSDVRARRDCLRRLVEPMADPEVGLVTSFYVSRGSRTLGAALEALSVNAQFLPQAAVAGVWGGMRFAMGAVMLVRRGAFEALGGFASLSAYLADDYRLGRAVQRAGQRIAFADALVASVPDAWPLLDHLSHMLRWARTVRVCQAGGYRASLLLQGAALLFVRACLPGGGDAARAFCALSLLRGLCVAWSHWAYLDNPDIVREILFLPLSELAQFAVWLAGLRAAKVVWRGERYRVLSDGRLVLDRAKTPALELALAA